MAFDHDDDTPKERTPEPRQDWPSRLTTIVRDQPHPKRRPGVVRTRNDTDSFAALKALMAQPDDFKPIFESPVITVASWNNVLTYVTRGLMVPELVEQAEAASLDFSARWATHGWALISIAKATATHPDGRTRDMTGKMMTRLQDGLFASALVYEGTGFRAAGVRAVVTGLLATTNLFQTNKVRLLPTVAEASMWVHSCGRSRITWQASELSAALERASNAPGPASAEARA